jgi:uncharacterized protein YjbJ (UPF0337 family)
MNTDRIEGKAKEVTGDVERRAGAALDNEDMEARGAARETEGKAQGLWGRIKSWLHI